MAQDSPAMDRFSAFRLRFKFSSWANLLAGGVSAVVVAMLLIIGIRNLGHEGDNIPVIETPAEPFKIQPKEAGGLESPYLGMEVNRIIAGRPGATLAEEAGMADGSLSFTFAPAPVELKPEDLSPAEIAGTGGRQADDVAALIFEDIRSASRPEPLETTAATGQRIDPDLLPAGTAVVQLGDFVSARLAEHEWQRLLLLHPDLLKGRDWTVQPTLSGGRRIFRLRTVGFANREETRRFCTRLGARGADCISTVMR